MLSGIGSSPVSSLEGAVTADTALAKNLLDEVRREVLLQGWAFNTDLGREFTPDSVSKQITVGSHVLRIDTTDGHNTDVDVVQRGTLLYDRENHTYEFDDTLTCDVVYHLEIDAIPEAAKRYITLRASRIFQDRVIGTANHHAFSMQDEQRALMDLKAHEAATGDHSIFNHWDVYRTVYRGAPLRRVSF